jgi:hypothetical protein
MSIISSGYGLNIYVTTKFICRNPKPWHGGT